MFSDVVTEESFVGGRFPKILHCLLQQNLQCVRWDATGLVLIIVCGKELFAAVRPYLRVRSFSSIQRQLNNYGFLRADEAPPARPREEYHYIHPHFTRNDLNLVHIVRQQGRETRVSPTQQLRAQVKQLKAQLLVLSQRVHDLEAAAAKDAFSDDLFVPSWAESSAPTAFPEFDFV